MEAPRQQMQILADRFIYQGLRISQADTLPMIRLHGGFPKITMKKAHCACGGRAGTVGRLAP